MSPHKEKGFDLSELIQLRKTIREQIKQQETNMQNMKPTVPGVVLGTLIGVAVSVSLNVSAFKENDSQIPAAQLKKFSEVFARIQSDLVEKTDNNKLITDAIRGMLSGLDPHSAYLDAEEFTELQVGTTGEFGGLGIEVGMENGFVKVISPIDDTPAQKAGIEAGDLIIRLDEKPVKGKTLGEAVKIMRGKPGAPITLTVVREGKDKPFKVKIIRAIIKIKSVKKRLLEANYGYMRITSFQAHTTESAKDALRALKKENNGSLKGLILDLRNNPGGVLSAAVGISDIFLTKGKIVYTEGRVADAVMRYDATNSDLIDGAPIIVLVNQGSASASEIVAGALQDHKRALILGSKTFGKGSVQTVLPLDQTTAVKLTTARYFTPSGRSIQAKGIEPDIPVEQLKFPEKEEKKDEADDAFEPYTEADLEGHLSNPDGEKDSGKSETDATDKAKADAEKEKLKKKLSGNKLAKEDYQLFEALNILKGMNLVQSRK